MAETPEIGVAEPGRRLRAFVGLSLPDPVRAALAPHLEECRRLAPGFRWTAPERLHVTLRFLGPVEPPSLASVQEGLAAIAGRRFGLQLGDRGRFGPAAAPRVLWLGLSAGAEGCAILAGAIEDACRQAGLEPEPRPFRAHLTLARARTGHRRTGEAMPTLPPPPPTAGWEADAFVLYESRLGTRPEYVELARYPLG
ncbi:MAG: RNA 2',3'-cyclic phosphodiesterase [Candidatus Dormibacteraeota bacterium]|nr:RNA 2',3'-cyclic phosphodiesterase [Candidatus Dormibacteraeota bacterium]